MKVEATIVGETDVLTIDRILRACAYGAGAMALVLGTFVVAKYPLGGLPTILAFIAATLVATISIAKDKRRFTDQ